MTDYATTCPQQPRRPRQMAPRQRGFTLAELMIGVTIGMLILAGMATLFVNNSRAQSEIEKSNRQVENGRYAMQMITGDARHAGFYGRFNPTPMADPVAVPGLCTSTLAALRTDLPMHIQGADNATAQSCLPNLKANTDVVLIRRVESCEPGFESCDAATSGGIFLQASTCNASTELGSTNPANHFLLDTATASLTLRDRTCVNSVLAPFRRYQTYIYYVATENNTGDGIPTLKRAELVANGNTLTWTQVPMVEGIENLQVTYGVDFANAAGAAGSPDGLPDVFTTNPAIVNGCAAAACGVSNWRGVVALKINVLARNLTPTAGHANTKTYALGNDASGNAITYTAPGDGYKRHAFTKLVTLTNPAGRRNAQ